MGDIMVHKVESIIGKIDTGVTEPLEGIINNRRAIIKTLNNIEGNKILINEFICEILARKLELPIPSGDMCVIDESTKFENDFTIDKERYGLGHFTYRIDNVTQLVDSPILIQKYIINKEDFLKIILFDNLIYNIDRHKGNILMSAGNKNGENKIYIIDHSHVFKLGPMWDKYQLKRMIEDRDYMSQQVMEFNENTYKILASGIDFSTRYDVLLNEAEKIKNTFSDEYLMDLVSKIPNEWEVDLEEKIMLGKYLIYRVKHLDKIVEIIYESIKNFN